MNTIAQQLREARDALAPVAGANAALEARLLAAQAWGMTPEALVQQHDALREAEPFSALLARRKNSEPVAQILGEKHFWKDRFFVSRSVLTPRADSETLIEMLLRLRPDTTAALRMLDLGTGSGCLLLSALREYPQATGVAVDASEVALAVASRNAAALGLASRVEMLRSNWCSNLHGMFDVVLANPPYIPTGDIVLLDADVRAFEPHSALDGGADGLDCYREIVQQLLPHTRPASVLLFEVGMGQAEDVATIGEAAGWKLLEIAKDLAGIARGVAFEIN